MTHTNATQSPREDWTLDQLGQFAQQLAKRTAHDAWLLGRAYSIAKAKAKAEGQKIEEWRQQWIPFLSQPTLSRYEAVGKLPEDDVKDKSVTEVYRLLGLVRERPSTERAAEGQVSTPSSPDSATGEDRPSDDTLKVVHAQPASLLERVASVVNLLHRVVNDLPSLPVTNEDARALEDALHDASSLLRAIRVSVDQRAVA